MNVVDFRQFANQAVFSVFTHEKSRPALARQSKPTHITRTKAKAMRVNNHIVAKPSSIIMFKHLHPDILTMRIILLALQTSHLSLEGKKTGLLLNCLLVLTDSLPRRFKVRKTAADGTSLFSTEILREMLLSSVELSHGITFTLTDDGQHASDGFANVFTNFIRLYVHE